MLNQAQARFKQDALAAANSLQGKPRESLKEMFYQAVEIWEKNHLSAQLNSNDLEYILRKLPKNKLISQMEGDDLFSAQLLELCKKAGVETKRDPELVAGLLRSVFFVSLHEERFSKRIFMEVIRVLFDLIVDYIVDDD